MDYLAVRDIHRVCAVISISLFVLRFALQCLGQPWRRQLWLRILPHVNDSVLLGAALWMTVQLEQYPLTHALLSAKLLALLAYILVGKRALTPGLAARQAWIAFLLALACVSYIVAVALTRSVSLGGF